MPAIEFRGVDIIFGKDKRRAIELIDRGKTRDEVLAETGAVIGAAGINLAIAKGEICVLMGLSGSGKSTILRAINGLNKVARGAVLIEHGGRSVDVARCTEAELRHLRTSRIAMVFQQFALLPWRTVRENVGFGLELRGTPPAERNRVVDEKLALVNLSRWADKYAHELSGGMQQRVGLARALATDADILLMDEPFSALDPLIRDKLQDDLLGLQQTLKKTIVFVSHDLDEALKIGNRIAILEGGRIVQIGSAEDILLSPADDYVAEFVKHMNPLNVLRGTSLMTPAISLRRELGAVLLDRDGRVKVQLDRDDHPIGVTLDGREGKLIAVNGDTRPSRSPMPTSSSPRSTSSSATRSSSAAPPAIRWCWSTSSAASPGYAATRRSIAGCFVATRRVALMRGVGH
jgi:glycine betaine/proline transport system ATP-binding protein